MKAIKAVSFAYTQTAATRELLETFRMMVNHAIHVCLDENIKGRLRLRDRIYREFREISGILGISILGGRGCMVDSEEA